MAVGFTVGRHAAADGSEVHPLVAAALEARPTPGTGTPAHAPGNRAPRLTSPEGEGELGWPGQPGDGTGLGWPEDTRTGTPATATVTPAGRRWDWRRLLGGRGSSAA
ncbi:hypothetical protein [Modestobacter sp. URMC 112]